MADSGGGAGLPSLIVIHTWKHARRCYNGGASDIRHELPDVHQHGVSVQRDTSCMICSGMALLDSCKCGDEAWMRRNGVGVAERRGRHNWMWLRNAKVENEHEETSRQETRKDRQET